jgi:membrane associated rhomboid family serine protease
MNGVQLGAFGTSSLILLCCAIHATIMLTSPGALVAVIPWAINPAAVLQRMEYYRIVSSAFVHGGVMHLAMNMSSLYYLGSSLERAFGTAALFVTVIMSVLLSGTIYRNPRGGVAIPPGKTRV